MYKIFILWLAIKTAACSCSSDARNDNFEKQKAQITKMGELPKSINESSGLILTQSKDFFLTHNDGGGEAELYKINKKGELFETITLNDAQNEDWEDITKDSLGNLYIGDFGNNQNLRKDLKVYKFNGENCEIISFSFANQTFDSGDKKVFDCEAFFWKDHQLYLFTKSWEKGKKLTQLYVLPEKQGSYRVFPKASTFLHGPVTGASVSPDGSLYALISYGRLYIYGIKNGNVDFDTPVKCIKIGKSQTEAVAFVTNRELYFTNEQGKIFSLKI